VVWKNAAHSRLSVSGTRAVVLDQWSIVEREHDVLVREPPGFWKMLAAHACSRGRDDPTRSVRGIGFPVSATRVVSTGAATGAGIDMRNWW